jgi:hypothetical protein
MHKLQSHPYMRQLEQLHPRSTALYAMFCDKLFPLQTSPEFGKRMVASLKEYLRSMQYTEEFIYDFGVDLTRIRRVECQRRANASRRDRRDSQRDRGREGTGSNRVSGAHGDVASGRRTGAHDLPLHNTNYTPESYERMQQALFEKHYGNAHRSSHAHAADVPPIAFQNPLHSHSMPATHATHPPSFERQQFFYQHDHASQAHSLFPPWDDSNELVNFVRSAAKKGKGKGRLDR